MSKSRPYKPDNREQLHVWIDKDLGIALRTFAQCSGITIAECVNRGLRLVIVGGRKSVLNAAARSRVREPGSPPGT